MRLFIILVTLVLLFSGCSQEDDSNYQDVIKQEATNTKSQIHIYPYIIVKTYPHNTTYFTEGLVMANGFLYESTGLYDHSQLLQLDLPTGKVIRSYTLPTKYFAEGITVLNNKIYQLTYQSKIGFVYDQHTFKLEKTFYYNSEGWGLTSDGKELIMSNGSSVISFMDPKTFQITKQINVSDGNISIHFLNELEYIHGKIFANVWHTNFIAIISPSNGKVIGWIDLSHIHDNNNPALFKYAQELNGIAFDEKNNNVLVTGKDWPYIYAIKLQSL